MYKEGLSKADAINKCKELIGGPQGNRAERFKENQSRETFLANMYQYFRNAVHSSQPAKDYLQIRGYSLRTCGMRVSPAENEC